jgi:lysophospholipase L1-like esterase
MKRFLVKFLKITIPVTVISVVVLALLVEIVVRVTWDEKKGRPGFFIRSVTRVEMLSPNYSGWYGGVPVKINRLGFRDPREYDLAKKPNTFRILVLGDSVTFGHGSIYESTYPYLLEARLKQWRPEVDWQVWNLGVPGYNTSQELAYLKEVAPAYQPDLVVVGFFFNDVFDNFGPLTVSRMGRLSSRIKGFLSSHAYSYHLYKKVLLIVSARLSGSRDGRVLTRNLENEEGLLQKTDAVENLAQQTVSPVAPIPNREALTTLCVPELPLQLIKTKEQEEVWLEAVRGFQSLPYRIVFFINIAPDSCDKDDLFYHGRTKGVNEYFERVLGAVRPTVSSYDAFYPYRPSQMPLAAGHSLGNSNVVKADTLFSFLRERQFVPGAREPR